MYRCRQIVQWLAIFAIVAAHYARPENIPWD
jgi:hypothetical protein